MYLPCVRVCVCLCVPICERRGRSVLEEGRAEFGSCSPCERKKETYGKTWCVIV